MKRFSYKLLEEKLKGNIQTELLSSSSSSKKNKFKSGLEKMLTLLQDHPYFVKRVARVRKVLAIPENGFRASQEMFVWEHTEKNKNKLHREAEKLFSEFIIPKVYQAIIRHFIYDYIACPSQAEKRWLESLPVFSIMRTDSNAEINQYLVEPDSTYIQVFDWTTERDLMRAWKKLVKAKKDKLPFKVSRVDDLARAVWKMSEENLNDHEIAKQMNDYREAHGKRRTFGYENVSVYRKRYRDALSTLKKIVA